MTPDELNAIEARYLEAEPYLLKFGLVSKTAKDVPALIAEVRRQWAARVIEAQADDAALDHMLFGDE